MGTSLQTATPARASLAPAALPTLLPTLWRDPHTVEPDQLRDIIARLEQAVVEHPDSVGLRTCLGMAHAVNHDAYRSMDALEEARFLDPSDFWAQMKFSELLYRLRALPRAEEETKRALDLAGNGWELSVARKQLQEIRRLMREGTQKPAWTKPILKPSVWLVVIFVAASALVVMR